MGLRHLLADTRPLRTPTFRRLWLANIVTVIGAQLTVVAVPAQIYALTGSSGWVGLTGLFGLVPLVVFGLWGGALADHFNRRTLLIGSTFGIIGTSGLFWWQAAVGLGSVWFLLVVFAVQQAFFALNQPARTAILPKLLPLDQLPAAQALGMTVVNVGAIAGPLVGGALLPLAGYTLLYAVDTLTLAATLWAVWRLPSLPVEGRSGTPGIRSVVQGLGYLRFHPVLLMSFLVDIIAMVFGMPRALFPQIAHEAFGGPRGGGLELALLFAAMPAGAVLGGVFSGWVSRVRRQGRAVVLAIAVWGVCLIGVGLAVAGARWGAATALVAGAAFLAAAGAADMASAAFRNTMLLNAADDAVRGRLQGIFLVVVVGGPRVADVLHGGASDLWGPAPTTWGGGVLVVVLLAVASLAFPVFWRYRDDAAPRPGARAAPRARVGRGVSPRARARARGAS